MLQFMSVLLVIAGLVHVMVHHQRPDAAAPLAEQPQEEQPPSGIVPLKDHQIHHIGQPGAACSAGLRRHRGLRLRVTDKLVAPVVIVAYDRVHYLAKTLVALLKHWHDDPANGEKFPLFVSVDDGHQPAMIFASAFNFGADVQVIKNQRDPTKCQPADGYCHLSQHYKMLLQLFFECHKAPRLIILEDDLEIAQDFFGYFEATAPLLERDPSIWCVSAWNDHGQAGRAANATALYRTDLMPGLGWMLSAAVGRELWPVWPDAYWDDWMRDPKTRKGRQCVFPEVPRTHTFGRKGVSLAANYNKYLAPMILNNQSIDWTRMDLSYLLSGSYDALFRSWLDKAAPFEGGGAGRKWSHLARYCDVELPPDAAGKPDLLAEYSSINDFQQLAGQLEPMMPYLKAGVPRASYNGTAVVRCRGRRLFIAPEAAGSAPKG